MFHTLETANKKYSEISIIKNKNFVGSMFFTSILAIIDNFVILVFSYVYYDL